MALNKSKEAVRPAGQPGGFEQEDNPGTTAAPAETVAKANQQRAAEQTAGVAADKAIAKASAGSLAIVGGKIETLFQGHKDLLPAIEFGTLPRFVGSQGSVRDGDKKSVGEEITVRLVSWNDQYVVSPGDDSDEAKALVKYSRDGKVIDETGEIVSEYLASLREKGYEDAASKQYCSLIVILVDSDKKSDHINKMVEISLSPSSRKAFDGYRLQQTVRMQMGLLKAEGAETFKLKAVVKSFGSNEFTLLQPVEL